MKTYATAFVHRTTLRGLILLFVILPIDLTSGPLMDMNGGFSAARAIAGAPQVNFHYAGAPWQKWLENPLDTTVSLQVRCRAATNTVTTVFLGTTNWAVPGISCTNTSTNVFSLSLKPYQPVMLVVTGASAASIKIDLSAIDGPSLLNPVDMRSMIPRSSKLLIDDVESGSIASPDPLGCTTYSNSWKIELRRQDNWKWRLDDDTDDPDRAPSEAFWPRIGPGKSSLTNHCAIEWNVSLGHLVDGNRAGKLQIRESLLSPAIYTPAALYYAAKSTNVRSQVEIIVTNVADNTIRQMRTLQAFVDIVPMTNQYEIRFYPLAQVSTSTNAQGLYAVTNPPFATWRVLNPDQNTNTCNRLHIVEVRGEQSWTNKIEFDSNQRTWTLTTGKGAEERQEKRTITFASSPTRRIETVEIRYTSGAVAHKSKETYEQKSWGWELVEAIADPDGAALTTSFAFYDQVSDVGYGRLKWIINPDGNWEKRLYGVAWEGGPIVMTDVLKPWKDLPSDPSNADTTTSYDIWYYYSVHNGPGSLATLMEEFPPEGEFTGGSWGGSARATGSITGDHNAQVKYRILGQLFEDVNPHGATGPQPTGFYYNEWQAPGLANQPLLEQNGWNTMHNFFYDFGSYDAVAEIFTGSNQPGFGPAGPAWQASELLGTDYPISRESDSPIFPYRSSFPYDVVEQCQGHAIQQGGPYGTRFAMERFRGTKITRIFEGGVLRQTERFVYTGLESDEPQFEPLEKRVYACDSLGHPTNIVRVDPLSGQRLTVYTANWRGTNSVDGVLLLSETDESGTTRTYTYDSLKRRVQVTKEGFSGAGFPAQAAISVTNAFDANGRTLSEKTVGGSLQQTVTRAFDLAGRVCFETNASGLVTAFTYSQGGLIETSTLPGGATSTREKYLDRRLKSATGTSAIAEYHTYGGDSGFLDGGASWGYIRWETNMLGSPNSGRYTSTGVGLSDRVGNVLKPGFFHTNLVETTYIYRNTVWAAPRNLLTMIVPPSGPIQRFEYDSNLEMTRSSLCQQPYEGMVLLALNGADRISDTEWFFLKQGDAWFQARTNLAFLTDNSDQRSVQSVELTRQTGFSSSAFAQVTTIDVNSNATVVTTSIDRANKKVVEIVDIPQSTLDATRITVNGLLQSESTPTVQTPTQYRYDSLGRQTQTISPLGATSTTAYDPATGQTIATTDFAGNTTTYEYYSNSHTNAGRLKCQTAANGKKTYYAYNLRGQLNLIWGDVPYPEQRIYDQYGDMVELRTYRGGSGWNGSSWPGSPGTGDVTTWTYDTPSGLLASKTDAAGRTVTYDYYTDNLLRSRTWARGVSVTNYYNGWGDLIQLEYTDGTSPVTFTNFNRLGQFRRVLDAAGDRSLVFDHAGRQVADIGASGLFEGITVSNHFNPVFGRDFIETKGLSAVVHDDFAYDHYGRLSNVVAGAESATYTYLANSDRLQSTVFKNNSTTVLTSARTWESGERLRSIVNLATSSTVSSHSYLYDAMHRRTQATLEDGSLWKYDYNDRNELAAGKRYWNDWTPVAGQQFEYTHDNIGNRTSTKSGGDATGANLQTASYTPNSLNQYTARTVPGIVDIMGTAQATATNVSVNSQAAYRKGEYYYKALTVSNGSGPVCPLVTNTAILNGTTTNVIGSLLVPPASHSLSYDADGNLTNDAVWAYQWDGQNQLKKMENLSTVPDASRKALVFAYDYMGRRVSKTVSNRVSGSWQLGAVTHFVYDGWNLLAEIDATTNVVRSYLWGQDLSGTMNRAGGIGGLMVVREHGSGGSGTNYFAAYDGNGNLNSLVKTDGALSARYEYSPFGELIRSTGPLARMNPFRWSTKFCDEESGLVYYGYRYYSPALGRWIGRDPIEEGDGNNLYAFVGNSPIGAIDTLGQNKWLAEKFLSLLLLVSGAQEGHFKIPKTPSSERGKAMLELIEKKNKLVDEKKKNRIKPGGGAAGIALGLGLVALEATYEAAFAASNVLTGNDSGSTLESYFRNVADGSSGMDDLDAAMAALEIGGYEAGAATVAWGAVQIFGEVFADNLE